MRSLSYVLFYIMLIFFLPLGAARTCEAGLAPCAMPVYINGEPCAKKGRRLNDGDELWLLSPASGG